MYIAAIISIRRNQPKYNRAKSMSFCGLLSVNRPALFCNITLGFSFCLCLRFLSGLLATQNNSIYSVYRITDSEGN
jgi:hypothetical protein